MCENLSGSRAKYGKKGKIMKIDWRKDKYEIKNKIMKIRNAYYFLVRFHSSCVLSAFDNQKKEAQLSRSNKIGLAINKQIVKMAPQMCIRTVFCIINEFKKKKSIPYDFIPTLIKSFLQYITN